MFSATEHGNFDDVTLFYALQISFGWNTIPQKNTVILSCGYQQQRL